MIRYTNPETEEPSKLSKTLKEIKSAKEMKDKAYNIYTKNMMMQKSQTNKDTPMDFKDLSEKKLQEAIIWAEILGKPMCKRRVRR